MGFLVLLLDVTGSFDSHNSLFFSVRTCSILKVNYSSDHGTSAGKDPVPEGACGTKKAPLKRAVTPIGNIRFLPILL
jgi:hypothetical protein